MRNAWRNWRKEAEPWYGAIGLANMVVGTSSVLIPLMLAQVLNRSVGALGLLSTLASLVGVIGSLVWGRLSDAAHRRKPFVVLSFAVVSAGFAGIAFVRSFNALLVLNMVLSFFWVANAAVTVLLVIENREKSLWERRISHLNQSGSLGWVCGLALGTVGLSVASRFIEETMAIRVLFLVLALGAAVASLLAVRFIPRTIPTFTQRRFRGVIVALGNFLVERARFGPFHLYHRFDPRRLPALLWGREGLRHETKLFLAATWIAFTAFGFVFVPLPFLLSRGFGLPPSTVFLYYVVHQGAIALAYPWASWQIKRAGNKAVQVASLSVRFVLFSCVAVILFFSPLAPPTWFLVLLFLGTGISWSCFQLSGVALASRLAKPEYRGQALGLYNAVAGVGSILAGVCSGFLAEYAGYQATFAAAAVLIAVALGVLSRLPVRAPMVEQPASRAVNG
jgi:MFS family permease